jgi:predicted nucleic acid-binding protein
MRFYLDSMVWIYAIEGNPHFGPAAQKLLLSIQASPYTILTSHFLLGEFLVIPVRRNDQFTVMSYRRMLLQSKATEVVPFDTDVAMRFAAIRAAHRVKPPDATHLALAASAGADAFITVDNRLSKLTVPGIGFIGDLNTPIP